MRPHPMPVRHSGLVAGTLMMTLLAACATTPSAISTLALPQGEPAPQQDYDWHFDTDGPEVQLVYGIANSDDIPFGLSCQKGSGQIQLRAPTLSRDARTITLATSETSRTYAAQQEEAPMFDGYMLEAQTRSDDPLIISFSKLGWLSIQENGAWVGLAPHATTKLKGRDFIASCQ